MKCMQCTNSSDRFESIPDISTGDDERPKCGRCRRLGKPCLRATGPRWKFRHQAYGNPSVSRESPPGMQSRVMFLKYVVTKGDAGDPALEYIDEAPGLTALYAQEPRLASSLTTATTATTPVHPPIIHLTSPVPPFQSPGSDSWRRNQSPCLENATNISLVSLFKPNPPDPPWTTLFGGETMYLRLSLEETCVLRYFVEDIAKWVRAYTHHQLESRRLTHVSLIYVISSAILALLSLNERGNVQHCSMQFCRQQPGTSVRCLGQCSWMSSENMAFQQS